MRKSLWIVLAALSVGIGAPIAQADSTSYTITFSGSGVLPTSGSFTYDSTSPAFSNFLVLWDGTTIDLTSGANDPAVLGPVLPASCAFPIPTPLAASAFALMDGACPGGNWAGFADLEGSNGFAFFGPSPCPIVGTDLTDCVQFAAVGAGPPSTDTGGGSYAIAASVVPTPEPATVVLMLLGLLGIWLASAMQTRRASFRPTVR